MIELTYPIAFAAGAISFFAPCFIPLLPAYIGFITGISVEDLRSNKHADYRAKIIVSSIFYILGFSIIFVLLGTSAGGIGAILRKYDFLIQRIGGLVILFFGVEFLFERQLPFLNRLAFFKVPSWAERFDSLRAFFMGIVFAMAWTPCVGAVLGSILALAAVSGTAIKGALLLFVYSLGISIPFMIISLTFASAPKYLPLISKHYGLISKITGLLLLILGVLLFTDTYKYLNTWLFDIAFKIGYKIR